MPQNNTSGWVGWVYFAGILMVVRAVFQGFMGLVALNNSNFYLVTSKSLTVLNFTAWGWVHLILAVVLLTAGFSLFHGGMWGRVVGIIVSAVMLAANLVFLPTYPIWCLVAVAIDVVVLYALVVHGNEAKI